MLHLHLDILIGNRDVPREDVDDAPGDFMIGGLRVRVEADPDILGDRLHAGDPPGGLLGGDFLGIALHIAGKGDDALMDGHADVRMIEARLPFEFRHHVFLNFAVAFLHG